MPARAISSLELSLPEIVQSVAAGASDPMLVVGNPVKLSKMAEGPVGSFPRLGADTDDVLRETLELTDEEIAALRAQGVID